MTDKTTLERHCEALAKALEPTPSAWRPIETAPRDGTRIVIYDGDVPAVGLWSAGRESWIVDWDHAPYGDPAPSLWLPLPDDING